MNGAESLIHTLVHCGVEACFSNPGTSEMHLVAALDRIAGMRAMLGLHESVVTGAADGYGRMRDRPALALLHLGVGLANGLTGLQGAKRAMSPIVALVGEHPRAHLSFDGPNVVDIEALARTVSCHVKTAESARTLALDGARAVAEALRPPGGVATLICPSDAAWSEGALPVPPLPPQKRVSAPRARIQDAADALKRARRPVLFLDGAGLREPALERAGRVAAACSARLMCPMFYPRLRRGAGIVAVQRLPYFPEQAAEALADADCLVLAGAKPPVNFFLYPDQSSAPLPPAAELVLLAAPEEDVAAALDALCETLSAPHEPALRQPAARTPSPRGTLDPSTAGAAIAAHLPEDAILVDEGVTSGFAAQQLTAGAPPHDSLQITGGAVGAALSLAVGTAVACPSRKVVCLHGDGGAISAVQALWTMAREGLDVTTVIYANRAYRILDYEFARFGMESASGRAHALFDLGRPTIDWVKIAEGLGVEASRAETAERFADHFHAAMRSKGPRLIEVVL
jgi:acetolactate synthase-1/2/3 large subunit